jgi:hypothetical protein
MYRDQVIDEVSYLVKIEFGRGMGIHHRRMIDVLSLAGQSSLDRKRLHIDICLHNRGQLRRQRANPRRLNPIAIHKARDLDTATCWQIVNEMVVGYVSVDDARDSGF